MPKERKGTYFVELNRLQLIFRDSGVAIGSRGDWL